jgi:hypothetical protein
VVDGFGKGVTEDLTEVGTGAGITVTVDVAWETDEDEQAGPWHLGEHFHWTEFPAIGTEWF